MFAVLASDWLKLCATLIVLESELLSIVIANCSTALDSLNKVTIFRIFDSELLKLAVASTLVELD